MSFPFNIVMVVILPNAQLQSVILPNVVAAFCDLKARTIFITFHFQKDNINGCLSTQDRHYYTNLLAFFGKLDRLIDMNIIFHIYKSQQITLLQIALFVSSRNPLQPGASL